MMKTNETKLTDKEIREKLRQVLFLMCQRCYNEHSHSFRRYGKRGIRIGPEWYDEVAKVRNVDRFVKWSLCHGYKPGLQIDRIDNDKGYSEDNCRWVTRKENMRNTSSNVYLVVNGERMTLIEASEKLGLPYDTIKQRIGKLHWDLGRTISEPVGQHYKITYNGVNEFKSRVAKILGISRTQFYQRIKNRLPTGELFAQGKRSAHYIEFKGKRYSITEFAKAFNLPYDIVSWRVNHGWNLERIISTPIGPTGKKRNK